MKHVDVAMVLITNPAGLVLMTKRGPTQTRPDLWELPGGRREAAETFSDAAVREAMEELGVHVILGPVVAQLELELEVLFHMVCFEAEIVVGVPQPLEAMYLRWVDLDDAIVHLPCVPSTYFFYKAIRAHRQRIAGQAPL